MANHDESGSGQTDGKRKGIAKYLPPADTSSAIATFLLVIVGIWGVIATGNALELSERAWISVVGGGFTTAPAAKDPIHFAISYMNSGKEPATDLNFSDSWDAVDAPPNDDFTSMKLPENVNCAKIEPKSGLVASPLPNNVYNRGFDTGRGDHPLFLGDDELGGKKYVIIQGCIAYRTFNKVHKAGYCTIFMIKPAPASPAPVALPQANAATKTPPIPIIQTTSTPEVPKLNWQAVLCPGGFSAD